MSAVETKKQSKGKSKKSSTKLQEKASPQKVEEVVEAPQLKVEEVVEAPPLKVEEVVEDSVKVVKKSSKKEKKPKKEKKAKKPRAKTAYNFFVSENMKKLMELEEWKSKKNSELMKECGSRWKSSSDEDKAPYKKMSEQHKAELLKQQENSV